MELLANLLDVSGNNHKVPVGEADQDIPITVPRRDMQRRRTNSKTSSLPWLGTAPRYCVITCTTSDRTRSVHSGAGRSTRSGFLGRWYWRASSSYFPQTNSPEGLKKCKTGNMCHEVIRQFFTMKVSEMNGVGHFTTQDSKMNASLQCSLLGRTFH